MSMYLHELINNYQSYNRNIKLAIAANIMTQIGMGIFMTLYNLYLRDLGYSELTNGNVIALTALAQTIFLVPAGFLSDRTGRKNVMLIGALFASMTLLGRSIFEWEMMLLILAFASGAFMSFIQVSMFSFGWATMGPLSTFIVAKYGSYWGYSYVFLITGMIYFIGALYFLFVFKEKKNSFISESAAV